MSSWLKSPRGNVVVRGDRRSEKKRREILSAARALFVSEGYADTGMEVVARNAAVSTATLYSHFPSKADLFRTTVRDLIHEIAEGIARDPLPGESARARLTAFATTYARFCSDPMTKAVLLMVAGERRKFADNAETVQKRSRHEIGGALMRLLQDLTVGGELAVEQPSWAAGQLLGMIEHPTLLYGLVNGDGPDPERAPEQIAEEAVTTFLTRYGVRGKAG
ncbi:MAG TPA: TetR/AcrR family transcriptional regulator [Caulobacteraceae bacterium]